MRPFVALATLLILLATCPAVAALKPGDHAPDFTLPAFQAGKASPFHLADALKTGNVVLYFFPAAHTPGCNVEAHLFSQAVPRFTAQGTRVVGISAGNTGELAAFSMEGEHCAGRFPVAADEGAAVARRYDALLPAKPEWSDRVSYLIGRDGRILAVHAERSPAHHVQAMLQALASQKAH